MEVERGGDGRGARRGWKGSRMEGSGGQDESARGVFAGGRTKARGENVAPKVVHSLVFLVVGEYKEHGRLKCPIDTIGPITIYFYLFLTSFLQDVIHCLIRRSRMTF